MKNWSKGEYVSQECWCVHVRGGVISRTYHKLLLYNSQRIVFYSGTVVINFDRIILSFSQITRILFYKNQIMLKMTI